MSKQRRRRLNRNKHTRSRRSFIRNGVEQLESRVLPGGFLDLLAGAAFASNFDLLPEEQLVPDEIESESAALAGRPQLANAWLLADFALFETELAPRQERVKVAQPEDDVFITSNVSSTRVPLFAASIIDSFFANNQFVDTTPSLPISQSPPLLSPSRTFNSPISQLGAGIGTGSGQGYSVTGAELPQAIAGSSRVAPSSMPAWMFGEGESGSSATGNASASASASASAPATGSVSTSASGSGGTPATSMVCTTGATVGLPVAVTAPAAVPLKIVDEGESFELSYDKEGVGDINYFTINWGDGSAEIGRYSFGDIVTYSYYDDALTNAPSDNYTITLTTYDLCDQIASSATGVIRVNNVAPIAEPDTADADEEYGTTVDVLSNDHDAGYDQLQVVSLDTSGTLGKVTLNSDGTITYDPDGKFNGLIKGETATDTFAYVVRDDDTGESTGTVTVTIHGALHVPVLLSGAPIDHSDSHSFDLIVYHDIWYGNYHAIPVATEQLFPDARSNTLSISADSTGSWYRPPFFFSARSAAIAYDVTFTCNGNKITANTNALVKKETNVFVQAAADSKATYNANQTQVTIDVGLASVYGNTPSTTISFSSQDSGDTIGASIEISGATWDIATTGTFVYGCQRW